MRQEGLVGSLKHAQDEELENEHLKGICGCVGVSLCENMCVCACVEGTQKCLQYA